MTDPNKVEDSNNLIILDEIDQTLINRIESSLNFSQRIILKLEGSVKIGRIRMRGWRMEIPAYLFKCPEHGYQIAYPTGFFQTLQCPVCIQQIIEPEEQVVSDQQEENITHEKPLHIT